MTRPSHLADYKEPPLNEVVLGAQFIQPKDYKQIYAGEVWELFKDKYPIVKELPALRPAFEIFGAVNNGVFGIDLSTGASHDRFWFISESDDELIQFQNDKFLHNWRKASSLSNIYPRYEAISEKYFNEITLLEGYLRKHSIDYLHINQCEITYINHIPIGSDSANKWLNYVNFNELDVADFNCIFRKIIYNDEQSPIGRLTCETNMVVNSNNDKVIIVNLTVRGCPSTPNIGGMKVFMDNGRNIIVNYFEKITTEYAGRKWGKK